MRYSISRLVAAISPLVLAAGMATAQPNDPGNYVPLTGLSVVGRHGGTLGEVEQVMIAAPVREVAVVVESDTALGLDEKQVILSFSDLELVEGRLVADMTAAQFKALPPFEG